MARTDIKDVRGTLVGWADDNGSEVKYWGVTKGLVGRFVKNPSPRFWYADGRLGPPGDIGYSEVMKAEGAR